MTNPETIIQNNIILELNKRGHRLWRANAGRVKTEQGAWIKLLPKGFPDTLGFRNTDGKFIAIEIKTQSGKLRQEQKRFRDFAINQPIIYGVARSIEDAIDIVENGKEMIT